MDDIDRLLSTAREVLLKRQLDRAMDQHVTVSATSSMSIDDPSEDDLVQIEVEDAEVDWLAAGSWADRIRAVSVLSPEDQVRCAREIEVGVLAAAVLSGEFERPFGASDQELRELVHRGEAAQLEMTEGNLRLLLSWSAKAARRDDDEWQENVQEGFFGLVRAIQGWDYRRGYTFATYASWWIRQTITRGLHMRTRNVRIPVHVYEALYAGRNGTSEETEKAALKQARSLIERTIPLHELDDDLGITDSTFVTDPLPGLEAEIDGRRLLEDVKLSLHYLQSERAERIIESRFGFHGEVQTLEQIGEQEGVTRERVRQIETKALGVVCLVLAQETESFRNHVLQKAREDDVLKTMVESLVRLMPGEIPQNKLGGVRVERGYEFLLQCAATFPRTAL